MRTYSVLGLMPGPMLGRVLCMVAILALTSPVLAAAEAPTATSTAAPPPTPEQQYADASYERGDYQAAMKQYLSLAKDGDNFAQYRVSYMYLEGQGLGADLVEAYAWAAVAAERGQSALLEYRDTVGSLVPESDRRKALRTADYYIRKWGRDDYAGAYAKGVRKEMRECTGSRVGARCGDIESMEMPQFWAIQSGSTEGGTGTAKPSGSTSTSVVHGTGTPRNVSYYEQLRASLRHMNSSIGESSGRVEVHEIDSGEDSAVKPDPEDAVPEGK